MNGQRFPLQRLPDNVRSEVLKTLDHHEKFIYSFLSKKAHSNVTALQLHISSILIRMEKRPTIVVQLDEIHLAGSFIEFQLKMPRSYEIMSSLNALPVSVQIKKYRRGIQGTVTNQGMNLGEWIQHFSSFSIRIDVCFIMGHIKFDIQNLRATLPEQHRIDIIRSRAKPNERDILSAQNLLKAFLPNVRNVGLHRVPLQANLSLQHIGMANLKHLDLGYKRSPNLVDMCSWNVESCVIHILGYQISLRDLNRFFKLWITRCNPKLKKLYIDWGAEIIPDWNVLLKGLKSIETEAEGDEEEDEDEDEEERGAKKYIIKNVHGINAIIKVMHLGGTIGVVKFSVEN